MTYFEEWDHKNLAKFAADATEKLRQQDEQIQRLRDDLRAAIDAYRDLLRKVRDA